MSILLIFFSKILKLASLRARSWAHIIIKWHSDVHNTCSKSDAPRFISKWIDVTWISDTKSLIRFVVVQMRSIYSSAHRHRKHDHQYGIIRLYGYIDQHEVKLAWLLLGSFLAFNCRITKKALIPMHSIMRFSGGISKNAFFKQWFII